MKLASKKCALLTRAKRQAAISSKRSAAMKLNPYVSPKLFENEALWQLTTIGWRMLNIANISISEMLSSLYGAREFNINLGLDYPRPVHTNTTRLNRANERMDVLLDNPAPPGVFTENLQEACTLFDLPESYLPILRYVVLLETSPGLSSLNSDLSDEGQSYEQWIEFVSASIGVSSELLVEALAQDSPLVQSGLVKVNELQNIQEDFLSVNTRLARKLRYSKCTVDVLLRDCVDVAPDSQLGKQDFAHLGDLWNCLADALSASEPCHVLLSGVPGTGKTQLALALSQAIGKRAALVKTENSDGDCLEGESRRTALLQGHHLMSKLKSALLIVDEAENLLDNDSGAIELGRDRAPSAAKAWMNRFLENSKLPTIWIVNNPEVLDPSILRRFTWVVSIPIPPRGTRLQILSQQFRGKHLSKELLEELASRSDLPPYEAKRLSKVATLSAGRVGTDKLVRHALSLADKLFHRKPVRVVKPITAFDPTLLNLNVDLDGLLAGLAKHGLGRLGFFGPPGTGKSMLAGEIARRLDKTLLLRTGSDLLGAYVGETEKSIAAAFEEAADEGAVLLLDEIDTLASNRASAMQSWERSQTNELLLRLERFQGVAILATNFRDSLDPALSRRLDRKIEFSELRSEQAWALFLKHAPSATLEHQQLLRSMKLRLGDFAAALRGLQACDVLVTATTLCNALKTEVACRGTKDGRRLGF